MIARLLMLLISTAVSIYGAWFAISRWPASFLWSESLVQVYADSNRFHPQLLHIRRPNMRIIVPDAPRDLARFYKLPSATKGRVDFRTDWMGFRNRRQFKRADIIVIGDSMIEQPPIGDDDLITTRLARSTKREVANLGQCGYGLPEYLHVLKEFGLPLSPRICVVCYFEGNDLPTFKNRLHESPPVATLPDGGQMWFHYPGYPLTDHDIRGLKEADKLLNEISRLCRSGNITLLAVFIPTKWRVYAPLVTIPERSPCAAWTVNDVPERLSASCKSENIAFLDLTPALHDAAANGVDVFFTDDTHWTEEGHRIAAEQISGWIHKH